MVLKGNLKTFFVIVALESEFFHLKYVRKSFKGTRRLISSRLISSSQGLDAFNFFCSSNLPWSNASSTSRSTKTETKDFGSVDVWRAGDYLYISRVGFAPVLKRGVPKTL
jgi:hypothetical protein